MTITLNIISYQNQTLGADSSKTFTEAGGSIGRAAGNDWVLPDPERYISGRHASISYQDGGYYITDTSTNGVFINGSPVPIGNGNSVPLDNGDRISFADYEFDVIIDNGMATSPISGQWDHAADSDDGNVITSPTLRPDTLESMDPLNLTSPPYQGAGDDLLDPFAPQPESPGSAPDHLPSELEAFEPPAASAEQIPDDWDMTDYGAVPGGQANSPRGAVVMPSPGRQNRVSPVAPPPAAPPAERPKPAMPPAAPQPAQSVAPQPVRPTIQPAAAPAAPPVAGAEDLFAAFLRGTGIDPAIVAHDNSAETMQRYGTLFREVVQGLMEVLMARASLKSEFRMMLTTIRPVENNPLKFSPSVDDAMRNLFMSRGGGYLSPIDSVREGFEDIKNHQMAMVAGMQAAFRDMLERLKPEGFEKNAKGGVRGALMPASRKSQAWEAYCDFYNTITHDPESSFQTLFGEEFARAYEEQIKRLSLLQKK